MIDILDQEQLRILRRVARQRALLAFDFDGTLAPIVRDPAAATMREDTRKLLTGLALAYPCAVISGRSRADVMTKVAGIPLRAVFGNHGMEPSPGLRRARALARRWYAQIVATFPSIDGVIIENKGASLAAHYRLARSRPSVRRLLLRAAASLEEARIIEGKMVVNLIPADAPNKGTALLSLCKRLRCDGALYVGDDDNDEDVFALAEREGIVGVRVGRSQRSMARFYLRGQSSIDSLLAALLALRSASFQASRRHIRRRSS